MHGSGRHHQPRLCLRSTNLCKCSYILDKPAPLQSIHPSGAGRACAAACRQDVLATAWRCRQNSAFRSWLKHLQGRHYTCQISSIQVSSSCRGKSESPLPRLEPKLFWSLQSQRVSFSSASLFLLAFNSLQETVWGGCARDTDTVIINFIITAYAQELISFKSGQLCSLQCLDWEVHTWKERELYPCSPSVLVGSSRAVLMSSNHTRDSKMGRDGVSLCTE